MKDNTSKPIAPTTLSGTAAGTPGSTGSTSTAATIDPSLTETNVAAIATSNPNSQSPTNTSTSGIPANTSTSLNPAPTINEQANSSEVTTVVTSPHAPQKYGGKKIIATIFGLLMVLGGVTAGVTLVQRQQNINERAQNMPQRQYDAQCSEILVYDQQWNQLTITDLSTLSAGSVVRFTVSGIATTGSFDKARFTINGTQTPEVTDKKPGTEEFYYEYTLPEEIKSYTVGAQVHHSVFGWI